MNTNIPALATVYADLESVLAKLQAIDVAQIESANLVPMVKALQAIGAFVQPIDAQIADRAVNQNELIPGVTVKPAVTHRKWHNDEAAAQLARETFGEAAFETKLKSPASIEKLEGGELFVSVAAYKPDGGKKAVY